LIYFLADKFEGLGICTIYLVHGRHEMKKLLPILVSAILAAQPLLSAGSYSSDTSSTEAASDKDPFAAVYQLIDLKKFSEAHSVLQLLDVPSKQADKLNLLGFTARKSGDYVSAATFYEKALSLDPKHIRALEYQGELFLQLGQFSDAEDNLEKIKKICLLPCKEEKLLAEAIELAMKN
jgi:tetratricopeptide (TPR) repeat protein